MKIAFIILAHNNVDTLLETIEIIHLSGNYAYIHFDAAASQDDLVQLQNSCLAYADTVKVTSHIHCEWGEWSLVQAPLMALKEIQQLGWQIGHIHLMSGADQFIKPISLLESFLNTYNYDFIESVNINNERWVQGGFEIERFIYLFPYNFIKERAKFDQSYDDQKSKGATVKIPQEITPHMGSQWWTLRWETCLKIISYLDENQHILEYFEQTWIPDESFFQTIIRSVVPDSEIKSLQLLYHNFLPNGRPFIFMNGHEKLVSQLPHFLIRKVSIYSTELNSFINESLLDTSQKIPSLDKLATVKKIHSNKLQEACIIDEITPWGAISNHRGGSHNARILALIHDNHHDCLEIAERINPLQSICYLGRPFVKEGKQHIQKLLMSNSPLKYHPLDIFTTDNWQKIQSVNTDTNLFVFSYIPTKDWIDSQHAVLAHGKFGSIALTSENLIRDALLKSKLQYEDYTKIEHIQWASLEEVLESLNELECYA